MLAVLIKGLIGLLGVLSIVSWTLIVQLFFQYRNLRAKLQLDQTLIENFQSQSWESIDKHFRFGQGATTFKELYNHFLFLIRQDRPLVSLKERLCDKAQLNCHRSELCVNSNIQKLSTIASLSPYIGLLATVLGIMQAFILLAQHSQGAHLQLLAPGLAEALWATAAGLAVAIPAQCAYYVYQSYFAYQHSFMLNQSYTFVDNLEFIKK